MCDRRIRMEKERKMKLYSFSKKIFIPSYLQLEVGAFHRAIFLNQGLPPFCSKKVNCC